MRQPTHSGRYDAILTVRRDELRSIREPLSAERWWCDYSSAPSHLVDSPSSGMINSRKSHISILRERKAEVNLRKRLDSRSIGNG